MRKTFRHTFSSRDLQRSLLSFKWVGSMSRDSVECRPSTVKALLQALSRRGKSVPNYLYHEATISNPGIAVEGTSGHLSLPISAAKNYHTWESDTPGRASLSGERRRYDDPGYFHVEHPGFFPGRVLRVTYLVDQALALTTQGIFWIGFYCRHHDIAYAMYQVMLTPAQPGSGAVRQPSSSRMEVGTTPPRHPLKDAVVSPRPPPPGLLQSKRPLD